MNTPTKGYYRSLLKEKFPDVRLAFTHTPIIGCETIDPTGVLEVLDNSTDPYARYYSESIRRGKVVAVVERSEGATFRNNGELFFKS